MCVCACGYKCSEGMCACELHASMCMYMYLCVYRLDNCFSIEEIKGKRLRYVRICIRVCAQHCMQIMTRSYLQAKTCFSRMFMYKQTFLKRGSL